MVRHLCGPDAALHHRPGDPHQRRQLPRRLIAAVAPLGRDLRRPRLEAAAPAGARAIRAPTPASTGRAIWRPQPIAAAPNMMSQLRGSSRIAKALLKAEFEVQHGDRRHHDAGEIGRRHRAREVAARAAIDQRGDRRRQHPGCEHDAQRQRREHQHGAEHDGGRAAAAAAPQPCACWRSGAPSLTRHDTARPPRPLRRAPTRAREASMPPSSAARSRRAAPDAAIDAQLRQHGALNSAQAARNSASSCCSSAGSATAASIAPRSPARCSLSSAPKAPRAACGCDSARSAAAARGPSGRPSAAHGFGAVCLARSRQDLERPEGADVGLRRWRASSMPVGLPAMGASARR